MCEAQFMIATQSIHLKKLPAVSEVRLKYGYRGTLRVDIFATQIRYIFALRKCESLSPDIQPQVVYISLLPNTTKYGIM